MLDRRRKGGASGAEVPWDEQAAHAVPATAPGPYTYIIGNDAEDKWLSGSQQWVSQMITVDGKVLRFTPEHRDCMKVMLERDKGGTPVLNFNVEQLALKLQRPRQTVQHLVQRIWQFLEHSGEGPRVMEGFRDLWAHRPEIRTALFKPTEPGT